MTPSIIGRLRLDACPKLHELDLIEDRGKEVRVIRDGASKWETIATRLHFDGGMITQIFNDSQNNMKRACQITFTIWLGGTSGQREPRTWDTVIKALREADLGQLAKDLETVFTCKYKRFHSLSNHQSSLCGMPLASNNLT